MDNFTVKPQIYFGAGSLEYLSTLKFKKAFVVTDPFMVKSGTINKVTSMLEKGGIPYEVFSDIVPDPPIELVAQGIKAMDKCNPDVMITLGGGSAIDASKAIRKFRTMVKKGLEPNSEVIDTAFIAIPTTSGTGSEVTSFSVITDRVANVKYPLVDESMLPDAAILDADLVKSVPAGITADTGIDVLTHAIEAYVSTKATDYTDALAEKAIKTVFEYLPKAYKEGSDEEARQKMHNASCIAGLAFTNASLGVNHSMAHILGGKFHIPHGKANAILLPYVIEYNAQLKATYTKEYTKAAERYAEIARFLGLTTSQNVKDGVKALIAGVKNLTKHLRIPCNIKEAGIDQKEFNSLVKEMSEVALKDGCTPTNPRVPTAQELEDLFIKVYNGK
ncbi:1-propanol dehydrogenase PduQ [Hathewaya histolytica]|uniref:Alcetaldehyde dehydrogenase or NADPH-dependent butanol dehydrogenase n=1 Tax=Hathewaya histolytica TaxID=1498 RepID=A0A4U9R0B0_HATHI|nr:1-propanol dehydrogenase PduQ [Hathewaya histolytica]VTQ84664.1 alcetaldehyde dehydrogenase or NADPH-dependent butanol dehydrogenase [Hathewaya histolytica]